jgi:hypothetical protein
MLFLKAKPLPYWLVLTLLGIKFVIKGLRPPKLSCHRRIVYKNHGSMLTIGLLVLISSSNSANASLAEAE